MKAVVMTGFGDVDRLELRDLPEPKPGPGEVKVRVRATSVNPIDWKLRRGGAAYHAEVPSVPGRDVAGEVVEVGEGVTQFRPGDRVMGLVPHTYAEFVAAKAEALTPIPEGLSFDEAAALPLVTTTGAQLIEEQVRPRRGETVLVTGAVGSVGRSAVFVAKQRGARVLAGVRARQKQEAEELGADQVVAIDDEAELAKLPELDAIADTVGGPTTEKLLGHLKKGGRLGTAVGAPPAAQARGIEVHGFRAHPDAPRLHALAEAAHRGEFRIPIGRKFPLAQAREATRLAEHGGVGKVVLTT